MPCAFHLPAGPKMRKWYGAASREEEEEMAAERERARQARPEDEDEYDDRPKVLVTNADQSGTGDLVVLQLILARVSVRTIVRNTAAGKKAFGDYIQPVSLDVNNAELARRSLKVLNLRC